MFFSEHLFWAHIRPGDSWKDWIIGWLAYSLIGYLFLSAIAYFRVRSFWGIFLAGALFGWLTEGVLVQTVYEDLPLSISFTGLGWHALLSVGVGWYALRRAIHQSPFQTVWLSSLIGLIYGLWAITWWVEPEGIITPPATFLLFSLVVTAFAILAYWVLDTALPGYWKPSKGGVIAAAVLILFYFLIVTVPIDPKAVIILPLLLASVLFPLLHNRRVSDPGSLLDSTPPSIPFRNYVPLLLIPILSTGFYYLAYILEWRMHTNWLLYFVVTPLGFVLWLISMIKLWQKKPSNVPNSAVEST